MNYIDKYLKYKNKYLNLKGGVIPGSGTGSGTRQSLRLEYQQQQLEEQKRIEQLEQVEMKELAVIVKASQMVSLKAEIEKNLEINRVDINDELLIDIIGGYILEMTGFYIEDIINTLNANLNCSVKINRTFNKKEHLRDLIFTTKYNHMTDKQFYNCIVPFGDPNRSTHWVYYDMNGDIHNSYTYNKQVDRGDQFCQTHALIMAYFPHKRRTSLNFKTAYYDLLYFWAKYLFVYFKITNETRFNNVHKQALTQVMKTNNTEDSKKVKLFIDLLNSGRNNLFEIILIIMSTPKAIDYVSNWGIT